MATLNLVTLDWLFTAALFVITVILVKFNISVRRKKEIMGDLPGYPGYLPLLGHAHLATQFTYPGFIEEIKKTRKENKGTLHIWVGHQLCAYVANPDDVENVFNRKDAINKGFLFSFFHSHSLGIVTSTTPRWNHMRRLANIPLAHKQMMDSFEEIFQHKTKILLQIMAKDEGRHDYIDINRYLSRCCQDITYGAHFGVDLDILRNEEFNAQDTVPMAVKFVFERMMKVWLWPDILYFMTKNGREMKKCVAHHQKVARKILSERKRILKEREDNMEEIEIEKRFPKLMDVYLSEQSGLTDDDIVHNIMDLMLVGFEAMSQTQGWAVLLLSMFPEYQDKLQAELDQVLGGDHDITLAELNQCQYLDMVVRECLRLFGLPVVIRRLDSDVPIEHYILPAESEIIIGMCMVHRDPRYWDHPDIFYPDHFLPEKVAARPKNAYVPFGLGSRKCPAYTYGMLTIKYVVAALLRKYRFTTKQNYNDLPLDLLFMYRPAAGFLVKFEPRQVAA